MQNYRNIIIDPAGDPVVDVEVTVKHMDGTLADIFNRVGLNENYVHLANPLTSNEFGEFEFHAANGTYLLEIFRLGFNDDLPKIVEITISDSQSIDFNVELTGIVFDSNGLFIIEKMPFRIFFAYSESEHLSMSTRLKDIVIRLDERRKYVKVFDGNSMSDWLCLDLVTSVAGRVGDVVINASDVQGLLAYLRQIGNQPQAPLILDDAGHIPLSTFASGSTVADMTDIVTGTRYRIVIADGEILAQPII